MYSEGYDTLQKFAERGMITRWPVHDPTESCQKVLKVYQFL
jgi:hypothetical protein